MEPPPTDLEIARVLRAYLRDGALTTMPRRGRKRMIVLEHIAQQFEPGLRYPETDVNLMLRAFWPDVAALRRYLVDAGLLARANGEYWRIGGRVDLGA
jgi:hypothetical protein